jgi:hypothetical protein
VQDCPICGLRPVSKTTSGDAVVIRCARCGEFRLSGTAEPLPAQWLAGKNPDRKPVGRWAASHAIRRMQGKGNPTPAINSSQLRLVWGHPLPNPQQQADLLILLLGDASLPPGEFVHYTAAQYCAEIGTQDDLTQGKMSGLLFISKKLSDKGLIDHETHPPSSFIGYRLTFEGWAEYEKLRRVSVESRTAFMAMSYRNADVGRVVADYFVPAVKRAGFDLFRLDSRPKAGLIDNRMRVEIRAAKFLVCDLTDENRGAYWESGFAEGAQKPVFYTCEKTKFAAARSHFDTEHMFTVQWDKADPQKAADELLAAIRNEFPTEALQPDLSKSEIA